jgi:pimeloyl-ACP methyl ester carboxylesterase
VSQPVLVLVSGLAADEATWRPQLDALSAEIECRPVMPEGRTIDEMVDAILDRSPPRFAIAGHSLGGCVALALQRRAPERVQGLALLNTNAAPDSDKQRENRLAIIAAVEAGGYEAVIGRLAGFISGPNVEPAVLDDIKAMMLRAGPRRFEQQHRAALDREDARPGLGRIVVPTLVVGSVADRVVPPEASIEIASLVPAADLHMVEGIGHLSTMESPAFVEVVLRRWLERISGQPRQEESPSPFAPKLSSPLS